MRALCFAAYIACLVTAWYALTCQPNKVAVAFDDDGRPTAWNSKEEEFGVSLAVSTVFFAFILFCVFMLWKHPWFIDLPRGYWPFKAYWHREENLPEFQRRTASIIYAVGAVMLLLLLGIQWISIKINRNDPPQENGEMFWLNTLFFGASCLLAAKAMFALWIPREHLFGPKSQKKN